MNKKYLFSPDDYFNKVCQSFVSPYEKVTGREQVTDVSSRIKSELFEILSPELIPFRREPGNASVIFSKKHKDYTVEKCSVEICDGLNMMYFLLVPNRKKGTGIVCLCGHGYGARQIVRLSKKDNYRRVNFIDNYQKNFASVLASEGHTVIVPEFIGFGEARLKKDMRIPFYGSSCETVSYHSQLYGFSTVALRVYQTICCVDILTRFLNTEKVGVMGISGGGLVALYSSCLDERIDKTCVCGYINTFETSILSMWHCPDNYIPGLRAIGDMYDFAASLAPRKLMMQYGTKDKLFPLEGARKAANEIKRIYSILGEEDKFYPVEFCGKHEVCMPEAVRFFKQET